MFKLLMKRDRNKLLFIVKLFEDDLEYEKLDNAIYYARMVVEINEDFKMNKMNLNIVKFEGSYQLINRDLMNLDEAINRLIISFSENSPYFEFINAMLVEYSENGEIALDELLNKVPMTRQNVYKLVKKINQTNRRVGIELINKQSKIFVKANRINLVAQIYRYYSLYFKFIYPDFDFIQLRDQIVSDEQIFIKNSPRKNALNQFINMVKISQVQEESFEEHLLFHMQHLGEINEYKREMWYYLDKKDRRSAFNVNKLFTYLEKNLNERFKNKIENVKFDMFIMLVFNELIHYLNFNSYVTQMPLNDVIQDFSNEDCAKGYDRGFLELINLFYGAYFNTLPTRPLKICLDISKGKVFEIAITEYLSSVLVSRQYEINRSADEADLIITDGSAWKHPNSVCISNAQDLSNNTQFHLKLLKTSQEYL